MESIRPAHPASVLVPVAGPLALGVAVGLPSGVFAVGHEAIATPAIYLGVAALMVPALYVVTSLCGLAPSLRDFARAVGDGLWAGGIALLGLAPPVAFIVATASADSAIAVGSAAFGAGVLFALSALFSRLFRGVDTVVLHSVVYVGWSAVGVAIGAVLYLREMTS